jgi:uncharacterized membrane protein YhaH (DUF805 family)
VNPLSKTAPRLTWLAGALVGAVFLAVAVLAIDVRREDAANAPWALVLLLVAVAASQLLLVVRGQLVSLALFPVVLVTADTPPAERLAGQDGWRQAARDERAVLFVRSRN